MYRIIVLQPRVAARAFLGGGGSSAHSSAHQSRAERKKDKERRWGWGEEREEEAEGEEEEEGSSLKRCSSLGRKGRKCFVAPDLSKFSSLKSCSWVGGCSVRTAFPDVCKSL